MKSLKELDFDLLMTVAPEVRRAVQAFARGEANDVQQRSVYHFIIDDLAGVARPSFAAPGSLDEMAWRNGRRFVGLQIVSIVDTPVPEPELVVRRPRSQTAIKRHRETGAL